MDIASCAWLHTCLWTCGVGDWSAPRIYRYGQMLFLRVLVSRRLCICYCYFTTKMRRHCSLYCTAYACGDGLCATCAARACIIWSVLCRTSWEQCCQNQQHLLCSRRPCPLNNLVAYLTNCIYMRVYLRLYLCVCIYIYIHILSVIPCWCSLIG